MKALLRRLGPSGLLAALVVAALPAAAEEGCTTPGHAAISALAGIWEVAPEGGEVEATSQTRPILDGCSFEAVRTEAGVEVARALIYFDPERGEWTQLGVGRGGVVARFAIETSGEGLGLSGVIYAADGSRTPARIAVSPSPDGSFVQSVELSLDGGATWESPRVEIYRLQGAPEPPVASPAAPASAPEPEPISALAPTAPSAPAPATRAPAPAGGVKVRSERSRYQPPASTVTLESPMTLEVELGPVADLPPGTAWRTTETAVYLVEDVRVPQVAASRNRRRSKTELEVTVHLRTTALQRRVDLEVELLDGEKSVGVEHTEKIALGKLIGSHDPRVGRPNTLRFAFDTDRFEALFADGKRPAARITVTVR